jgi:transposase
VLLEKAGQLPVEASGPVPVTGDGQDAALDGDERAELVRLRRENAQLKMDREFLKKAAAFFASDKNR